MNIGSQVSQADQQKIVQDAAEPQVLEKALECATFQMQALTNILPGKFSYLDKQLRYQFVSKQYEEWYEKPREEILGRTVEDLMGAEGYQKLRGYLEDVLSGKEVHYEFTKLFKDGQERTMKIDYIPHISSTGEVLGFLSSCQDITEHKRVEKDLQWMTFQMNSLSSIVPGKFSYIDSQLRYRFVSKDYQEWYQKPSEEIVGKTVEDLMGKDGAQKLQGYMEEALTGKEVHYEFTKLFEDGEERTMIIDYIPHFNSTGDVLGFFVSCQDITELKRLREALNTREMHTQPVETAVPV